MKGASVKRVSQQTDACSRRASGQTRPGNLIAAVVSSKAMWRWLLIFVFVFQFLQMGLANAHVTAETAHAVAHGHAATVTTDLEISPNCEHCQTDGTSHACHDNHSHHTPVVGLGLDPLLWLNASDTGLGISGTSTRLSSGSLARIDRPKWATTTPVVVNF